MQNMMPQLNLSGRAVPQAQVSRTSGKSGESSGKGKDSFRNLLENPSGSKNAADEKMAQSSVQKEDGKEAQPVQEDPQGQKAADALEDVREKPIGSIGKNENEDAAEENALLNVGIQMFQFLLDSNTVILQTASDTDSLTGSVPEMSQAAEVSIASLTQAEEDIPVVPMEEMTAGLAQEVLAQPVQAGDGEAQIWPKEEKKEQGSFADAVSQVRIPAENAVPSGSHPAKASVQETGQKEKVGMQVQVESVKVEAPVQQQEQASVSQESGQSSQDARRQTADFDVSVFSGAQAFRQEPMHYQTAEMAGAAQSQTVHMQVKDPQELISQLIRHMEGRAALGNQEFEIQIHPENLGKLAIKVAYAAEKVSVSIVCSSEKTMQVLSAGAKTIAQIMEENLGTPTTVIVDQQEDNYLEQYKNQEQSRQQQQQQQKEEKKDAPEDGQDFLQQLRLGLI